MPLNLNDIRIVAQHGRDAATNVGDAASELAAACRDAMAAAEDLRGSWTGDNATAYIQGLEELIEGLQERATALSGISDAMYETVALYEQQQKDEYYAAERARQKAEDEAKKAKSAKNTKKAKKK